VEELVDEAIVARGLTKVFRVARRGEGVRGALRGLVAPRWDEKTAVDGVSFTARRGELLALLGPNGAGKSTTIKMLTGILTPTSGSASVAGVEPYRERERSARNLGAVFGQRSQLWWDLPARESFAILRDIFGVREADYRARLREFDDLLELSSFWTTRVRHLSLGQRVRCDLAAALLHDPPVVFLDEPTIGMDVVVKEQVRGFLRHQVEQRERTVLLTTHDMTEVERLAERVVLINHGRIALDGSLDEARRRFGGGWRVRITVADDGDGDGDGDGAGNGSGNGDGRGNRDRYGVRDGFGSAAFDGPVPPGLELLSASGAVGYFGPDKGLEQAGSVTTPQRALKLLIQHYDVADVAVEESDLEEVMREAYRAAKDSENTDIAANDAAAEADSVASAAIPRRG
jgi:ABC-2 type transport system ATP-binding protein